MKLGRLHNTGQMVSLHNRGHIVIKRKICDSKFKVEIVQTGVHVAYFSWSSNFLSSRAVCVSRVGVLMVVSVVFVGMVTDGE